MSGKKEDVITIKVTKDLIEAMKGVGNRSEFIRNAIIAALDGACPLCGGTGVLTPAQKAHWEAFSRNHSIAVCKECNAVHLVCRACG